MSDDVNKPGRGRPKTLNKSDVAEIAMNAYWEHGPTEVSMNAICQLAGASKPSVYREFGNDDGLTKAALEKYAQCVLSTVMEILGGEESFPVKVRKMAYMAAEDPIHKNGCLFVKMRTAKNQMGEKTQAFITAMEAMAIDAYAQALNQARENGDWTSTIPTALAAQYLYEQIGLALDQRARGEDPKATLDLALSVLVDSET